MKKPIAIGVIVVVAIIIGISSTLSLENDDSPEIILESTEQSQNNSVVMVTTTTNVVTDLVENIGGEHVQVTGLMATGQEPRNPGTLRQRPNTHRYRLARVGRIQPRRESG